MDFLPGTGKARGLRFLPPPLHFLRGFGLYLQGRRGVSPANRNTFRFPGNSFLKTYSHSQLDLERIRNPVVFRPTANKKLSQKMYSQCFLNPEICFHFMGQRPWEEWEQKIPCIFFPLCYKKGWQMQRTSCCSLGKLQCTGTEPFPQNIAGLHCSAIWLFESGLTRGQQ